MISHDRSGKRRHFELGDRVILVRLPGGVTGAMLEMVTSGEMPHIEGTPSTNAVQAALFEWNFIAREPGGQDQRFVALRHPRSWSAQAGYSSCEVTEQGTTAGC